MFLNYLLNGQTPCHCVHNAWSHDSNSATINYNNHHIRVISHMTVKTASHLTHIPGTFTVNRNPHSWYATYVQRRK